MSTSVILGFLTLTFLEVILGIDNVIFMLIAADKLPQEERKNAINAGMIFSVVDRKSVV